MSFVHRPFQKFSPSSIAAGGTSTLTIVIGNPGTNPVEPNRRVALRTCSDDAWRDGLAAPLTTSNTCTAGSTAGTLQDSAGGGLGIGDVGIRISPAAGATIAPNGTCTITALVTAPTAGNYSQYNDSRHVHQRWNRLHRQCGPKYCEIGYCQIVWNQPDRKRRHIAAYLSRFPTQPVRLAQVNLQ